MDLENIVLDPIPVKKWEVFEAKLKIWLVDNPTRVFDIPCFPVPYTKLIRNLEAELCMISDETPLYRKIAVSNLELFRI